MLQQWINAFLGIWIVVVPFLGFRTATLTWLLPVTGVVIAVLAIWGASEESANREDAAILEHRVEHQRV